MPCGEAGAMDRQWSRLRLSSACPMPLWHLERGSPKRLPSTSRRTWRSPISIRQPLRSSTQMNMRTRKTSCMGKWEWMKTRPCQWTCKRAGTRSSQGRSPAKLRPTAPRHCRACLRHGLSSRPPWSLLCGSPRRRMKMGTTFAPQQTRFPIEPRPPSLSSSLMTQSWSAASRSSFCRWRRATPTWGSPPARATTRTAGSSRGRRATCSGTLRRRTSTRFSGSAAG
mmetsp:Transcript_26817/g.58446  ORF Transcript_26817/g.58446 Transcript_26817/m.58446 type:complete len:225 (-) Transcript_26817:542-1216(-)